ncbi:MAG: hypothetical protein LBN42_04820 [Oscillospiraceae bacterium]|nr:hypothetical protein [Oscillospiraceae bacterium]
MVTGGGGVSPRTWWRRVAADLVGSYLTMVLLRLRPFQFLKCRRAAVIVTFIIPQ